MMHFTPLKTVVILGLCLLGTILCIPHLFAAPASWPPWRQVHLGSDLRGGSYLLLEVDTKAVVKERLDSLVDGVRQALRPGAIFYQTLETQPDQNRIALKLRDSTKLDAALAAIRPLIAAEGPTGTPEFDVASSPDGTIMLTLSPVALNARARGAVQQSIEIVRRRINETSVVDPQITQQGETRILVQLPGISDPNRIKDLLGKIAHMTFQLVDETTNPNPSGAPPPGVDFLPMQDNPNWKIAVQRLVDVDGSNLTDARAGSNPLNGEWVVNFAFNSIGTRQFADVTRANVNHRFAIVLDGKVISAPVIREPITGGRGQISGSFTAASANDLAMLLRAGALPAPLTVVEERSVGP
jgi:preprotein translocase subunit SecD